MNKTQLLALFLLLVFHLKSLAQNELFNFTIPSSMVLIDTMDNGNEVTYSYEDVNGKDILQKTIFLGKEYEYNYFKNSTNETFHMQFDSLNRIVAFGHKNGRVLIGYGFYNDGSLKRYQMTVEDTVSLKFSYTDSSFSMEFHPNGTIKTRYYCLDIVQEYKEYWSNGKLKIVADFLADNFIYCGRYREYDENGKLAIKGQYCHNADLLEKGKKCGVWKYYENGKRVKKERY